MYMQENERQNAEKIAKYGRRKSAAVVEDNIIWLCQNISIVSEHAPCYMCMLSLYRASGL